MHYTVLWNVYIHDSLFSGHVIITDAVAVGIRSYRVSPINVLDTASPRPRLATHTAIGRGTATDFSGTRSSIVTLIWGATRPCGFLKAIFKTTNP